MTEPAYKLPRETDGQRWPAQGEWTYEDYLRLPEDGNRYEVIRGVLYVSPAPATEHQYSSGEFAFRLSSFVRENGLGRVFTAPYDVRLPFRIADPVEPDVMFFRKGNEPRRGTACFEGVPDLLAEILSPGTRRRDRTVKLKAYQDAGVPEYWLIDPDARTVVVYLLERGKYIELVRGGVGDTVGSSVLPGFRVNVTDVFMP
ncbi:MAG TPA: Uma2 family endonuclease [Thermoanaerobaculia bacterium]